MNSVAETISTPLCDRARERLLSVKGDPFLFADWERPLFFHFAIAPDLLRPQVPPPFHLELYEGKAWLSLAALTMRNFRPCRPRTSAALFPLIARQRFLNFRTYVNYDGEPGALFLHGWLSRPLPVPLPSGGLGLPYAFASSAYEHDFEAGSVKGRVIGRRGGGAFAYRGAIEPGARFEPCPAGSLAEFLLERYTGFFCRGAAKHVFRASHPPWLQAYVDATIEDMSLVTNRFPWFHEAKFAGAHFAPGFPRVMLGRAHRLPPPDVPAGGRRKVLSAFYEMP
jgi:uncharacterized protein YqjF (DUF2071 family)